MRLTPPWEPPQDRHAGIALARQAVELGVTLIDTADFYCLGANEELLAEALHPYPEDLVIATKVGSVRASMTDWMPLGRPQYLRHAAELSLRRLRVERIDLLQLHRVDPLVPFADQLGAFQQLKDEGKIAHIGLSEVTLEQLHEARRHVDVSSVQNRYSLLDRGYEDVIDACTAHDIAFLPWRPIATAGSAGVTDTLHGVARELDATPAQVSLAWLLSRSPVLLPIPGTTDPAHLSDNIDAASLTLTAEQTARLAATGHS